MGLISGQRANTGLIEAYLGTAFDAVQAVADNIDVVIAAVDSAQRTNTNTTLATQAAAEAEDSATAAAGSATNASASETAATTKAGEAAASATTAINNATTSTTKATEASNSATAAAGSATIATTKATAAATSESNTATIKNAVEATAAEVAINATTAATKADEAEAAKVAAEAAAVTATTKANLTTTKANEVAANTLAAAESASTATTQAAIATDKAALTVTKATAAESAALQAAQSAASILGSVSEATEQAGIATTKASETAAHAATVAGSVTVVVQRTNEATAAASTATTQAGIATAKANEVTTKLATVTAKTGLAEAAAASAANAAVAAGTSASVASAAEDAATEQASIATAKAAEADAAKTESANQAAAAGNSAATAAAQAALATSVATADLETALPVSAYIKDVHRHAVERASGGRQTVLYDDLGNPSVMNIIPIFRYEDLGYTAAMGTGVATCFDVGTGTNKSEIFIGAFQSSLVGSRAVSLPRTDQAINVNFDTAKTYCANKGAGWHLMTMHEWAAISLWCMANGFEPRGNTNYGRAHDRYVERGRRMDGRLPGDAVGTARVHGGSGPDAWRHNNSPWGISDMVGNVWEWLDGFKLQDGQIIASTFNTQAEANNWVAQAAYFDATLATGGAPKLSNAVVNRLGTIRDNQNAGYSANEAFNVMTKAGTYVSNQLLKRLLVEPTTVLPKGRVYMRNFGERLPFRGGDWNNGSGAGLAALNCYFSRVYTYSSIGFRLAFA